MKKKFVFILIVLFVFSFTFIGCDDPKEDPPKGNEDPSGNENPPTNPDIIGKWDSKDEGAKITVEFKTDKTFEISKALRGTYTFGDEEITMKVTGVHGNYLNENQEFFDFGDKWYSQAEIAAEVLAKIEEDYDGEPEDFDEYLTEIMAEYEGEMESLNALFGTKTVAYEISEDGETLSLKGDLFGEEELVLAKIEE